MINDLESAEISFMLANRFHGVYDRKDIHGHQAGQALVTALEDLRVHLMLVRLVAMRGEKRFASPDYDRFPFLMPSAHVLDYINAIAYITLGKEAFANTGIAISYEWIDDLAPAFDLVCEAVSFRGDKKQMTDFAEAMSYVQVLKGATLERVLELSTHDYVDSLVEGEL